MGTGYQKDF
jgi:hypothetical protein